MVITVSRSGSWVTHNFRTVLQILHTRSSRSFESTYGRFQRNSLFMSEAKLGSGYWMHPGLQFNFVTNRSITSASNGVKSVKAQPPVPSTPRFRFTNWIKWVLGSALTFVLPLWNYMQNLQRIEGEAEVVVEEVGKVANVVENVATMAEKAAEDVAENLPENSNIKKAALVVENVSKQAAHDAHLTQDFIHKVDELKNDLGDLESFVEPIIDKIAKKESQTK